MTDVEAYRARLNHSHRWQALGRDDDRTGPAFEWCPGCGAIRPFNPEHGEGPEPSAR